MGRMIKAAFTSVFAVVFFALASCTASSGPDQTATLNAKVHNWIEANLTEQNAYRFDMTIKTYTQCGAEEYPQSTSYYVVTVLKDEQLAEIRSVGTVTYYSNSDLNGLMQKDTQESITCEERVIYMSVSNDLLCMYLPTDNGGYRLKGIRSQSLSQTVSALLQCETIDADCSCVAAQEDVHAAVPYTYVSWEIDPNETYQTLYELTGQEEENGEVLTAEIVYELENDTLWATFDNAQELYWLVVECFEENADSGSAPSRATVTLHFDTDRYDVTEFSVPTV